ncbi:MAG: hypothetical protein WD009_14030 [Phycisphaeraceae bacterium]
MKLSELTADQLRHALRATERVAPASVSARILREELERREQASPSTGREHGGPGREEVADA